MRASWLRPPPTSSVPGSAPGLNSWRGGWQLAATLPTAGYQPVSPGPDRQQYQRWWPEIRRPLAPRGLLVVDNAISHRGDAGVGWRRWRSDPAFMTALVPVGKGEWLVARL